MQAFQLKYKRGNIMATIDETAVFLHKQWNGKIETTAKAPVKNREDIKVNI